MLFLAIGLFLLALFILVVDIYIEGFGPLGVVGLVLAAASLFISIAWITPPFGWILVIGKIIIMVPGTILFFRFLRSRQLDGKFILSETLNEDVVDVSGLEYLMGKEGIAKTALRPHGRAEFNGAIVEVNSDSRYIPSGKRIKVVDVKDRRVFVTLVENAN